MDYVFPKIVFTAKLSTMSLKTFVWAFVLALATGSVSAQDLISPEQLAAAEKIFDLQFTPVKRDSIMSGLTDHLHLFQYMHQQDLPNDLSMSLSFDPVLPGVQFGHVQKQLPWDRKGAMGAGGGECWRGWWGEWSCRERARCWYGWWGEPPC